MIYLYDFYVIFCEYWDCYWYEDIDMFWVCDDMVFWDLYIL